MIGTPAQEIIHQRLPTQLCRYRFHPCRSQAGGDAVLVGLTDAWRLDLQGPLGDLANGDLAVPE